ncbi:MAG: TlpA family protein disulfide reductase [Candidatus Dormibacteria bacterium]
MRFDRQLAVALVVAALTGCGARSGPGPIPAPEFTMRDLAGRQHTLSEYRGKVVVVNFWATWCIPCRAEIPDLVHEARIHTADTVVLGVDQKEGNPEVAAMAHDLEVNYPVLLDTDGRVSTAYGASALPYTVVLDRRGRIVSRRTGIASRAEMEQEIAHALPG